MKYVLVVVPFFLRERVVASLEKDLSKYPQSQPRQKCCSLHLFRTLLCGLVHTEDFLLQNSVSQPEILKSAFRRLPVLNSLRDTAQNLQVL